MNIPNLRKVMRRIQREPVSVLNMYRFHCDTTCGAAHCIGGWAQILAGKKPVYSTAKADAITFLDLTEAQAERLFYVVEWPEKFGDGYHIKSQRVQKTIALARIRAFIESKGRE